MAYHGIIWGLLSNDVGKAIRHSWALWLSLPCFHPPWESAGLGALEPWRATLGLPCLVPHRGEKLFRKQKVVCHRENMHVIEKIFSGSFFFSHLGVSLDLRITASNWLPTGKYIELMTADVDIDNLVRRWFSCGGVNVSRGPLGPSKIHVTHEGDEGDEIE